ncbi:amidohydrolase family protein [Streptomyces sp. DG2A-72]|uniref:amidohydrolase family protein n=1 Tax=Streptomyces sp. DG2A-72 TaxID=3051386 RepID=UPI00265C3E9D|nr:amidohydrolase family protein [Streptomyces sp. DG2A-72]MDO0932278.1 amidohydrolase family protein [Streptomyces sp. DG2A-72]
MRPRRDSTSLSTCTPACPLNRWPTCTTRACARSWGWYSRPDYGWHCETSLHALRLIVAGVFDRWPGLKIIIGHLGEGIPFHLGRIDDMFARHADRLAKPVSVYFRHNFWVTTSGYFFDGPFQLAREAFGDDRIILFVDYPFSDNKRATDWFQQLDLPNEIREQIAYGTAEALLGITTGEARPL